MDDMPVYLFTGFLESGKTSFIDETLADKRFNNGQRTLLLVCEEGEAEYDESRPYMKNEYLYPTSLFAHRGGSDGMYHDIP